MQTHARVGDAQGSDGIAASSSALVLAPAGIGARNEADEPKPKPKPKLELLTETAGGGSGKAAIKVEVTSQRGDEARVKATLSSTAFPRTSAFARPRAKRLRNRTTR